MRHPASKRRAKGMQPPRGPCAAAPETDDGAWDESRAGLVLQAKVKPTPAAQCPTSRDRSGKRVGTVHGQITNSPEGGGESRRTRGDVSGRGQFGGCVSILIDPAAPSGKAPHIRTHSVHRFRTELAAWPRRHQRGSRVGGMRYHKDLFHLAASYRTPSWRRDCLQPSITAGRLRRHRISGCPPNRAAARHR
jgi:hypothetical protein